MIAADVAVQRPRQAKLLAVDRQGRIRHLARSEFVRLFRPGDLVIANDAGTLPASLFGTHVSSGRAIELRLAGRSSLSVEQVQRFSAVLFGTGDFRTRTEDRPLPPPVHPGDCLRLGPLTATIRARLNHVRLVELEFDGSAAEIWAGLARHGRPIQYAHLPAPMAVWDAWTPIATLPVAFEPPSAGFVLDWNALGAMTDGGVRFATITHAAGISSTGDADLDALLPFDEPYRIPSSTARILAQTRAEGGRIIAIGTTVVRGLEHAAGGDGVVRSGDGLATQKIGPRTLLVVVDAILSGTHEPGTSHYELLRAFVDDRLLEQVDGELNTYAYRTHEFGDSVFIERGLARSGHPAVMAEASV